jgi:hypothetical protein
MYRYLEHVEENMELEDDESQMDKDKLLNKNAFKHL